MTKHELLIADLVDGMIQWAHEGDGEVPEYLWDSFQRAEAIRDDVRRPAEITEEEKAHQMLGKLDVIRKKIAAECDASNE